MGASLRIGPRGAPVVILVDGEPVPCFAGETVAAALLAAGRRELRRSPREGGPRGAFCLMGACQECAIRIGGRVAPACMVEVRDGLAAARRVEPDLSRWPVLASHCAVDGFASAYLTGLAFRRALVEAGVRVFEHCPAAGVDPDAGGGYAVRLANRRERQPPIEARRLVLAGGAWLGRMVAWLGVRLPVRALVNQLAVTERLPPVMRTVVGVASGLLSLKQFANGTAVVGGGWQASGDRERGGVALLPGRLVGNLRLACHAVPALRAARLARTWAGLEAETRDALPAVGPLPGHPDAFVCGSVHSGFTSGPWTARLLADRILGKEPAMPLFPPDRSGDLGGRTSPPALRPRHRSRRPRMLLIRRHFR